jgi:hypothetical protein
MYLRWCTLYQSRASGLAHWSMIRLSGTCGKVAWQRVIDRQVLALIGSRGMRLCMP